MTTKTCNRCQQTKVLSEFFKCSRWRDGLDYSCKVCRTEMNAASLAKVRSDPKREAARRERINSHRRERTKNDQAFRDKLRARARARYQENPEPYILAVSRRKARLLGAGGSHSSEAWRQMKELFGHRCVCCGRTERITKDHIIAITRGGTDDILNIQPLCIWCNKSKFTRDKDYRTREKVVLQELNEVGKLLFSGKISKASEAKLAKHKVASRFTGVYHDPSHEGATKIWRAKIQIAKKTIELGRYETKEEAARAYNDAARKYRGPHACVNDL